MKYTELLKELKKNKCYLSRHGKKHDIWFSPSTGKEFPVPRHASQDVPNETLKNIKKDAGI